MAAWRCGFMQVIYYLCSRLGAMHDLAADARQQRLRAAPAFEHSQIPRLPDLQRSDLGVPPEGPRPFNSQHPQGVFLVEVRDRKSTRLNSSHPSISYAVFCLKKKTRSAP